MTPDSILVEYDDCNDPDHTTNSTYACSNSLQYN